MTKEEILAMEAGRHLDKAVAELMGKGFGWRMQEDDGELMPGVWHLEKEGNWAYWSPSTDISAAWLVVERMKKEIFSRRHFFLLLLQQQTIHEVKSTRERIYVGWPDVFWHITPESICKAALIAKHSH